MGEKAREVSRSFLFPPPPQPAFPHTSQSEVMPAQPVPILPGFDECQGCLKSHNRQIKLPEHHWPGLETPPQLKGGTSGPSRHLYSAVIDVSQTSVTPSGGTQSAPTLSPASLFMSPPFIWQSKVYEPPRLFYPLWGPRDKGRRCTQRPPLYLQERVMLIQLQPGPLQHMDGRLPAWPGHDHWGPGHPGPRESPLTQRKGGPSLSGSARVGPLGPRLRRLRQRGK